MSGQVVLVCIDYDSTAGTCAVGSTEWQQIQSTTTGALPALSVEDATTIAYAIAMCWAVAVCYKLAKKALDL